jgi:hypothetical protein
MTAYFIAAASLRKIDCTLCFFKRAAGRIIRQHIGETATHRDPADLRKIELFNIDTKALKCSQHECLIRAMHQHAKMLAAKAVNAVVGTKRVIHHTSYQQQHFFGDQMTMLLTEQRKVVNDGRAEPVIGRYPMATLLIQSFGRARRAGLTGEAVKLLQHRAVERVIKGFTIKQAGQGITVAVLQQGIHVAVNTTQLLDHQKMFGSQGRI